MNYYLCFRVLVFLLCPFVNWGQPILESSKMYRWTSIVAGNNALDFFQDKNAKILNGSFFEVLQLKVANDEIELYFDSVQPGNFGEWSEIPDLRYILNENTLSIIQTTSKVSYLTANDQTVKRDSFGNPIILYTPDGTTYYDFESTFRPLNLSEIPEIKLLETGKVNRKTKEIDFQIIGIAFQSKFSKEPIWMNWNDLKKAVPNFEMYPFVQKIQLRNYKGFVYRQEGIAAPQLTDNIGAHWWKIPVKKMDPNPFTRTFFENIASLEEPIVYFNYKKEPWTYLWESENFDFALVEEDLLKSSDENSVKILVRKGQPKIDKLGNIIYKTNSEDIDFELDTYISFNWKEICEIRVQEKRLIVGEESNENFQPASVLFVTNKNGKKRSLFLLDLENKPLFDNLCEELVLLRKSAEFYWQTK